MTVSPRDAIVMRREDAAALLATLELEFAAVVTASADSNADDEHDPEGATIGFERAQLDASIADLRQQIADLDSALGRVANGTYGICAVCGMPIPDARLAVRPSATTCVQHAVR